MDQSLQTKRKILLPQGWPRPKGYANGIVTSGELVFLAGIIGWDETETFQSDNFSDQFAQALKNIVALLEEAKAHPRHIVRMTWFITDREAYLKDLKMIGKKYREIIGPYYPTMSVVEVKSLMEERAMVEIEVTAVIDDDLKA